MTYLLLFIGTLALTAIKWTSSGLVYAGSTLLWLVLFQFLTRNPSTASKWRQIGGAFVAGYIIRHFGASGLVISDIALLGFLSAAIFGLLMLNGHLTRKWNGILGCLFFPSLWMAAYKLLMFIHLPSAMRIDSLFFDWTEIIQTEALIGADGLAYLILLSTSLAAYGISRASEQKDFKPNRKVSSGNTSRALALACSLAILILLSLGGSRLLAGQKDADFYIRCAYTTGPYIGDFINFSTPSYETCIESLTGACEKAAKQNAEVLVFNEEAFSMSDSDAEEFLQKVKELAQDYGLHILYGIGTSDTDGSDKGKSTNKIVWVTKDGQVLDEYVKCYLVPAIEAGYVQGNGKIPVHTVSFEDGEANISFVICYDSNFTDYLKQIRASAEVLFLPSWDWRAVTDLHYHICGTIPVQNQLTLLKPTYDGITIAVSPYGEVLEKTDTADDGFETVHIVELPVYKKQ